MQRILTNLIMGKGQHVIVIGSGFAGLSAASTLAQQGYRVTILEKNEQPGGRARLYHEKGFTFDMGPSWYWMPDVFEDYYSQFGHTASDFYDLKRLDPSYRVFATEGAGADVPAAYDSLIAFFESREKGSGEKLRAFLDEAKVKYDIAMSDHVHRLSDSITEFFDLSTLMGTTRLQMFHSLKKVIRSKFKDPLLVSILEFPSLFLGATPETTPALYSMMNYADLVLGTWYPMGGMYEIIRAMVRIAEEQGVEIITGSEVTGIDVTDGKTTGVICGAVRYKADAVIATSDYHYTEQALLPAQYRRYDEQYWDGRTMSPSALIYYLGVDRRLPGLLHHNLFFDEDFAVHAREIYSDPQWPSAPLFYVCAPSVTDAGVAPEGSENLFLLMPLAPGLEDTEEMRSKYFDIMISRLEQRIGQPFRDRIVVQRSYCIRDFERDYHAYKGNAYGLANTLMQTAILKPKMRSAKVKNLLYAGQLTVPGPGVPPAIISGQIAARDLMKQLSKTNTLTKTPSHV